MAESNQPNWRKLCAAAATEPDSEKLADLIDQIIKALDQRGNEPKQCGEYSPTVRRRRYLALESN
jgi:hypothetical protein